MTAKMLTTQVLRHTFVGVHIAPYTILDAQWWHDRGYDCWRGAITVLSDYEELSHMPLALPFEVFGLEMAVHSGLVDAVSFVVNRMRDTVAAATRDEHDRWLTMLAYLGKEEEE